MLLITSENTFSLVYYVRRKIMAVSYKKLFKLLIDRELKKKDLCEMTGVSASTISKMAKDEMVSMETVSRICEKLNCTFDDVVEIIPEIKNINNKGCI